MTIDRKHKIEQDKYIVNSHKPTKITPEFKATCSMPTCSHIHISNSNQIGFIPEFFGVGVLVVPLDPTLKLDS